MFSIPLALVALFIVVVWIQLRDAGRRHDTLTRRQRVLEDRLGALERALQAIETRLQSRDSAPAPPSTQPAPSEDAARRPASPQVHPPSVPERQTLARPPQPAPSRPVPAIPRVEPVMFAWDVEPDTKGPASRRLESPRWLLEFFTTGNVVAKAGIVVVFFGVAFLVRYTVDRGLLPIEYRLMAAAAGALGLLAIGWRLRRSRPDYAIVLQGGGIGVLYMTIFAAFRLYSLLPASLTFALLLAVVVCSGVLAVVQGDMALAVLGTGGGFLAPLLASTGRGSHVALFTYYAVLNVGVLGIAWFRSWRFLNWLAFVFTFGIGATWGWQYYRPELMSTTEPFLVFFFLLFVAIALLFAHRQPPRLRGYIDGSLVFGTPAVAFGMQSVLVRDIPFARAYSAVIVSVLYLGLTRWLWRRDPALRVLAEAFLALSVVFLVLAVPFAFDGPGTAAAWALEGAALVWLGVRQHRALARVAGAVTLIGAGIAFVVMPGPRGALPVLNAQVLSGAAIAAGSLLAARFLARDSETMARFERALEWALLVWGLLWWCGTMLVEIDRHVRPDVSAYAALFSIALSGCVCAWLARRWAWRAMTLALVPLGPFLWLSAVAFFALTHDQGPWPHLGWVAWPAVLSTSYLLVLMFEDAWPELVAAAWHTGTTWLLTFLIAWASAVGVGQLVSEAPIWSSTLWCIVPALMILIVTRVAATPPARLERWRGVYGETIPAALVGATLVWVIRGCFRAGSAAPLPYIPLVNPLELTQAGALLVAYVWWKSLRESALFRVVIEPIFQPLLAGVVFLLLNAAVGRVVHFYAGVPFDAEALAGSGIFHTGISILWAVTAGALMTIARRSMNRPTWITGAGLLAMLLLKLFVIDLSHIASVARIVSFLATGVLILAIGYFAPLPPRTERSA